MYPLADFEPLDAERMKHVFAKDQPTSAGGAYQQFAAHLADAKRDLEST